MKVCNSFSPPWGERMEMQKILSESDKYRTSYTSHSSVSFVRYLTSDWRQLLSRLTWQLSTGRVFRSTWDRPLCGRKKFQLDALYWGGGVITSQWSGMRGQEWVIETSVRLRIMDNLPNKFLSYWLCSFSHEERIHMLKYLLKSLT